MTTRLCTTFQELASETWATLEWAQRSHLRWSEETNTETLLRALHCRHPHQITIRAIPKAEEAVNGADWEWWIGQPGCWLGMRVQAKRIKLPVESFAPLQSYKASKATVRQIDALIATANGDKVNPLYCLYTYAPNWAAANSARAGRSLSGQNLNGCMIGHAGAIRSNGGSTLKKLTWVLKPWHTLVCSGAGDGMTCLGDIAYAAVTASFNSIETLEPQEREENLLFPPVAELPSYLAGLEKGVTDADLARTSRAAERSIKGFVIIRGGEEAEGLGQ